MNEKFTNFSFEERESIEKNKENRQSYVFSSLLKLFKFGSINDFIQNIKKNFQSANNAEQINQERTKIRKCSYLELAKEIKSKQKAFTLKLVQPDVNREPNSPVK